MIRSILRRAALVALREIANGCADALDEPHATDRLRAFEARVDAFADVLRDIYQQGEAGRLEGGGKVDRSVWCVSIALSDVNRMLEALTDEVQS